MGEKLRRFGLGKQMVELQGVAYALVAQGGHQPAMAGWQLVRARAGAAWTGRAGTGLAWTGGAGESAGGEAGHEAVEAAGGAGEVAPERDDEGDVAWVVEEGAGDEGGERGKDDAQAPGDAGGGVA